MISLDEAIRQKLLAYGPLTALIAARIYPATYPQDSILPVVVYQQSVKVPQYHHGGEANFAESRYQISSFASTYLQAKAVSNAVKAALRPWMAHQEVVGDLQIGSLFIESESGPFNKMENLETLSAYHALLDCVIAHSEDN